MKKLHLILFLVVFTASMGISQTDIGPDTRINVAGDWGKRAEEIDPITNYISPIPQALLDEYAIACKNGNEIEKARLGKEMDKYLRIHYSNTENAPQQIKGNEIEAEPQWGIGDIIVQPGSIKGSGFRQLDLKFGEDGNLYLAVNRSAVSGYNGYVSIYRSTNGGRHWINVSNVFIVAWYIHQITMLVEKRHLTLDDSTRVILYFTAGPNANTDDARLGYATFRRNGSAFYTAWIATPPTGYRFEYPSACSDGMYHNTATYLHVVAALVANGGATVDKLVHFRTVDWCISHTSADLNTPNNDFYPSAAFSRESGTMDSIYIAVERKLTNESEIRVIITSEVPTTNFRTYYITAAPSGVKYEKPCITIPQQAQGVVNRIIFITSVKDSVNRVARYHYSVNSGTTWNVNYTLGTAIHQADFTWCNSDSLIAGGGYIIATFVDIDGDSVTLRRGIPGTMGTPLYKRNSYQSTGILPPVVAIYKVGTTKYSTFAYAGFGPFNVYFNAENLPALGITPIGTNIPDKFELSQNYPNPFNPYTKIDLKIMNSGPVTLKIYDMLGREVYTLINEYLNAGTYSVTFDANNFTSGIYIYKLNANGFTDSKKMILIK